MVFGYGLMVLGIGLAVAIHALVRLELALGRARDAAMTGTATADEMTSG